MKVSASQIPHINVGAAIGEGEGKGWALIVVTGGLARSRRMGAEGCVAGAMSMSLAGSLAGSGGAG